LDAPLNRLPRLGVHQREESILSNGDQPPKNYSRTFGVTQALRKDIIEYLSAKYTANATLELAEVMSLYNCPETADLPGLNRGINAGSSFCGAQP
jgi:hypothetical protein